MWNFIKREKYFLFELYTIVRMVGVSIGLFASSLLVQDKFCAVVYGQSRMFCQNISEEMVSAEDDQIKNDVFSHTIMFTNYS